MNSTRWWNYLSGVMRDDTATKAAKKTGISASNFTRWKQGANADPEFVVKVARAYNVNVLRALVEAEFITEEEAAIDSSENNRLYSTFREFETETNVLRAASDMLRETLTKIKASYVQDVLGETVPTTGFQHGEKLEERFKEACKTKTAPRLAPVPDLHDPADGDGIVRESDYSPDEYAAESSSNEQEDRERRGDDPIA